MSSSNWDSAVIKSIGYVGIGIAVWSLFNGLAPSSLNDVFGLVVTFLLYISSYFVRERCFLPIFAYVVHVGQKKTHHPLATPIHAGPQ